jgi:hypothetical protein
VVYIHGYRQNPPAGHALAFDVKDTVAPDATFSGTLIVPVEAPPGAYGVSALCATTDVAYGRVQQPFTVTDEPPITTTSTTSTSIPLPPADPRQPVATSTTSTTVSAEPDRRTPEPAPARAQVAPVAPYTG